MLDALVDRQDGDIARVGQAPVVEQALEVAQHLRGAVALLPDFVNRVGRGQHQRVGAHLGLEVVQQLGGAVAQEISDLLDVWHQLLGYRQSRALRYFCGGIFWRGAGVSQPVYCQLIVAASLDALNTNTASPGSIVSNQSMSRPATGWRPGR